MVCIEGKWSQLVSEPVDTILLFWNVSCFMPWDTGIILWASIVCENPCVRACVRMMSAHARARVCVQACVGVGVVLCV